MVLNYHSFINLTNPLDHENEVNLWNKNAEGWTSETDMWNEQDEMKTYIAPVT